MSYAQLNCNAEEVHSGRILEGTAKIGIVGLGYVGLPLALLFSEERFPVTGFDVDVQKVEALNKGRSYIYRIQETDIAAAREKGFSATADYAHVADMDAMIICVPTPLNDYREPDLSYIEYTARAIAPHLRSGQLIVLESTTYPGTTEEVLVPILEAGNKAGLKAARNNQDDPKNTFLWRSHQSEKTPAMTQWPARIFPKL